MKDGEMVHSNSGMALGRWCSFCQTPHSASCCHPGRIINAKYLDRLASARAIMQKFVSKVDRGMAKSVETYAEMTEWLEE